MVLSRTGSNPLLRLAFTTFFALSTNIFGGSRLLGAVAFRTTATTTRTTTRLLSSRSGIEVKSRLDMTLTNTNSEDLTHAHAPASLLPNWMLKERTLALTTTSLLEQLEPNDAKPKPGGSSVVYWMQRDVRTVDNWALLWAADLAASRKVALHVVYALPPPPPPHAPQQQGDDINLPPALADMSMTERHGMFLLGGLECVWKELQEKNIPLHVIQPASHDAVGETVCETLLDTCNADMVVCDFSPIRNFREWKELQAAPILSKANVPFYTVDAHNIVPVWSASEKRQVGARTLRPKIHKVISQYLQSYPALLESKVKVPLPEFDRQSYETFLQMDESVPATDWAEPGTKAAMKQFDFFAKNGLKNFDTLRNDPVQKDISSDLSPWINYGHVSFASITKEVKKLNKFANGTASFIEEGVIRRELSDNFVYYSPNDYDSLETAAGWVKETLTTHASDAREYLYTLEELEEGQTHDDLWNAAQLQVVREGRMHGFLRMYWAKKILEWTESPNFALRAAQYLNDKYALDGKDSNGFTGVGWSIMGIHDQGWKERPVFGKVRFMNYAGCKRKFKVATFVAQYPGASENAIKATQTHSSKGEKRETAPSDPVKKKKPKTSA